MTAEQRGAARPAGRSVSIVGAAAYAVLFVVALPWLLSVWMHRMDRIVSLPAYGNAPIGLLILGIGLALMAAATLSLWTAGRGLPMSPFPPERLVTSGVYALVPDPIYIGAVIASLGYALMTRSAAGLWIATPLLALACASFVLGYERQATRHRFGARAQPGLRLPPLAGAAATAWDRAAVLLFVLLPWAVAYEAINRLGTAPDARSSYMAWEAAVPVIPWTEAIYALTYPYVLLAPFLASRQDDLRRFAVRGLWATATIGVFYLLIPFVAAPKPVPDGSVWAPLLQMERRWNQHTSLPSFHVVWTCLTSALLAARWPRARWWLGAWTLAIAMSCVTSGMHAGSDVIAGLTAAAVLMRGDAIWAALCRISEAVANSWKEWRMGPLRVMSHGVYAAVGGAVGVAVAVWVAGASQLWWIVAFTFGAQAGAALWAQIVEGSPQLLRPYGYFGSVVAVIMLSVAAGAAGRDAWLLVAAMAVGGCFTQALGRLRCLVQGCCHGRPVGAPWGIRYTHPRSRVTRLSNLGGVALHPAPLYSILSMLLTGAVLVRLWVLGAPLSFIVGSYFVLVGLGRFVEEHYRGEPQTAQIAGLRLYQWLAIAFVVGGSAVMAVGGRPAPPPQSLAPSAWGALAVVLLVSYVAFGVDVPGSNRRFSRLV
jgi:prolipoprotein diacylglyceryltransferase/protein-S-isoprenylcysteine O-methyltransferase Ste14